MSARYASRLSEYPNKGKVGLPEFRETSRAMKQKLSKLSEMVKESKHLVVLTGAGISTSAGIPDFRGPKGIWTLEKKQKQQKNRRKRKRNSNKNDDDDAKISSTASSSKTSSSSSSSSSENASNMDFSKAQPTLTHQAITKLCQIGKIKYCVTQNVDGLHRRAGLSRQYFSAIHGCAFTEQCKNCGMEYFRDYDIGGMSFQPTGRYCSECPTNDDNGIDNKDGNDDKKRGGILVDTLLDWEDGLSEEEFERSQMECDQADLVLCLGTSLRIVPASDLPLRAQKFVVVNFQKTPHDSQASLIIHASVDDVMDHLLTSLGYDGWKEEPSPPIQRQWRCQPRPPPKDDDDNDDQIDNNENQMEDIHRKKWPCEVRKEDNEDDADDEKKEETDAIAIDQNKKMSTEEACES